MIENISTFLDVDTLRGVSEHSPSFKVESLPEHVKNSQMVMLYMTEGIYGQ